jgi:hypothetical protein
MKTLSSKWLGGFASLLALVAIPTFAQTPQLIQVSRDVLKPGVEQDYAKIEEEAARLCVTAHCPNPYLAIETVDEPKEVWIINGFDSEDQAKQVLGAYQQNAQLVSGLKDISARKQALLAEPSQSSLASMLVVLSGGPPWWNIADVHYLIITRTRGQSGAMGAVYAADDGATFEFRIASTLEDAQQKFKTGDPTARIFEVKPSWGLPDKSWVARNPTLWAHSTPIAR